jgi:1-acyl-sn-glycerol-3-phosphate acyltransferase
VNLVTPRQIGPDRNPVVTNPQIGLPTVWRPLAKWFTAYSRRYIQRHFQSFSISRSSLLPIERDLPIVLYANHPGWWDPLVGLILKASFFPDHTLFAPIDAAELRRYKILSKIGFFGVQRDSRRGVIEYFRTAEKILANPKHLLAVTPQARFVDARDRPVQFQKGLGHLATLVKRVLFVPVAIEYAFWDRPLPQIFCRFGKSIEVSADNSIGLTGWHWTSVFERHLELAQNALAKEVCLRDPGRFEDLMVRTLTKATNQMVPLGSEALLMKP